MLDDEQIDALVCEIFTRLTLADEISEYDLRIPAHPHSLLRINGGPANNIFTLQPITVLQDGSEMAYANVFFKTEKNGALQVGDQKHQNIAVRMAEVPHLDLYEWLHFDPWNFAAR